MSISATLSIIMTLVLGLLPSGCGVTSPAPATRSFAIQNFAPDGASGQIQLSWTATPDAKIYRVWIAKNPDCSQPLAQVATTETSHRFGRTAPGTFYACVQAVPSYQFASGDSCSDGLTDVDGQGFDATNQGQPLTVEAQQKGRWSRIDGVFTNPELVDTVGGVFIRSGTDLWILNEDGQRLKQLPALRVPRSSKTRYAYANDQVFAMSAGLEITSLHQWSDGNQTWNVIHEFPGRLLVAFHLISGTDLSFVLRTSTDQSIQWRSLDPANPSLLKASPVLISGADNWGYGYFDFASQYAEGAFVIADGRGLHRLTTDRLETLALQADLNPSGLYFFPSGEAEYAIHLGDGIDLHANLPTSLLCSYPQSTKSDWIVWNSKTDRWRKFPIHPFDGYTQLISDGPVSLPYLLGGRALQLMNDNSLEFFSDLPPQLETILSGSQLPQDKLLLAGDGELWLLETSQP